MLYRPGKVLIAILVVLGAAGVSSQQARPSAEITKRAVAAAEAFLATLTPAQRSEVHVDLNEKTRTVWSNLPTGTTMQVGAATSVYLANALLPGDRDIQVVARRRDRLQHELDVGYAIAPRWSTDLVWALSGVAMVVSRFVAKRS
ncbi:MAG: DUF3500 domain-containing protein [Acidimicrobiia bacterium]|nr:DUF3500 domain-containing protein [Acidimicrobiia bacterium]